ncbi:host specificity factor TipJ family phage tail protein [Methylobacterium brachythecii]|uniref:Tip attachment protein J domain-containing protein n=1 Tax=Methylobacterium brachythecii TaxID=1176177 RepID=A0A7W6F885_9HYPH|nr:host specificity factor TipJ family phage tail protein [Methylobacterium brachythecii]MBB3904174.1 hypothetical protein [Methylobacterium brachythecii]GLS45164.1 hypothetical protein GCM10007884_31530 [Methylobacterium brachythecii]
MTLVLTTNVVGQTRGEPVTLPNRRRRLSTIVARHRPARHRDFVVSVHRRGVVDQRPFVPSDATAKIKAQWSKTLIGPNDVVVFTVVPGRGGFASIGLAIASIALIALAPVVAPLISGSLLFGGGAATGVLTTAIQAGMVVGGIGLAYAAQQASAAKDKTQTLYSVSGGGNVPKPGGRKPLQYGECWSVPPLSQRDYFRYDGVTMVLTKRLTLGIGKYEVHQIKVGDAVFWDASQGGLIAPFNQPVTGTDPAAQTAIEFLYEQPSTIAPGDAIASGDVAGQEVPRVGGNPNVSPWFRAQPQGVVSDSVLLSWTIPAVYLIGVNSGERRKASAEAVWMARRIDPDTGAVIGQPFELLRDAYNNVLVTTASRFSKIIRWPAEGAYEVNAQNIYPDPKEFGQNSFTWDEMTAFKDDVRVRPQTSEIVMRVRAGPGLTVTAFSDVSVLATRIVPVFENGAWVDRATRKAVWSYADLVRANYGLALDAGADVDKAAYYAGLLTEADTFDGVLPEVSGFWEAASLILHPMRADPIKVGSVHSFVRDEPQAQPRRIISRRQTIRDSGTATFKTKVEGGDVIVEYEREGDPKKPDEVRYSYGPPTRTPKRYKVPGITEAVHALKHAKWLAACAVFRGAERSVTTSWDGRLIYPGDHILSDMWFLKQTTAYGVASFSGNVLTLDYDASVSTDWVYGSIRTRVGKDWGIIRVRGQGVRSLELHASDVSTLTASSGLALADVLARESQAPTTVVVGGLTEMQQTWVARSAVPADEDHVQIEMVRDDPRVWQIVGETPIIPVPIGLNPLDEPLIPEVDVLHARCDRIETGIEVVWGVSATRGARNYEADLSYDGGATWDVLSAFGPASSGRAMMQQTDGPVTVRARAFGRTGLHGGYAQTTFLTVAPVVDGSFLANLSVDIAALTAEAQKQIADVSALGSGLLALDTVSGNVAIDTAHDTIRGAIQQLATMLDQLADVASDRAVNDFLQRQEILVGTKASNAAISREVKARSDAVSAIASIVDAIAARLTTAEGQVSGAAQAVQSLQASVSTQGGQIDAISQQLVSLSSTVSTQGGLITGNATAISTLTTRANTVDGQISVTATSLQALSTTVNGQTATLTTYGSSIDGLKVQYGVTGSINGVTGGFVMTGVRRNDGAVAYTLEVDGSLIVTGSVTAAKMSVLTVSSLTANLGAITAGSMQSPDGKWVINLSGKAEYFYD